MAQLLVRNIDEDAGARDTSEAGGNRGQVGP